MTAYCLKCKQKTQDVNPHGTHDKNGRPRMASNCAVCGSKKSVSVSKADAEKMGSGFFGSLLGTVAGSAAGMATGLPLGGVGGLLGSKLPF